MGVNSIDELIVSSAPVKRLRNISYKSNPSNSFVTNCESGFDSVKLVINSKTFDFEDFKPRKRYKPNPETMAYYYRYLGHFKDVA